MTQILYKLIIVITVAHLQRLYSMCYQLNLQHGSWQYFTSTKVSYLNTYINETEVNYIDWATVWYGIKSLMFFFETENIKITVFTKR